MKGEKSLTVGDRTVNLRLDWGAVEDFCEEWETDFSKMDSVIQKPKAMRSLIWHMARSAGEHVDYDELRSLSFGQISVVNDLMAEAMGEGEGAESPRQQTRSTPSPSGKSGSGSKKSGG